jgi:dTDP-glucose 4,6-dehydratase
MKRLLLTGGCGSIGCHTFAHICKNTDWEVVILDSLRHRGWMDRIYEMYGKHPEWEKRLTIFTHDLTTPISPVLIKKIGHIDYIINMASLSDVQASIDDPVPFGRNNAELIFTMSEYARETKPEVFLQISTDEVYGPTDGKTKHKEWDPIVPSNPYSASKAMQENWLISYWRTFGLPLVITNFMNNFGEMQSSKKYPVMLQKWITEDKPVIIHGVKKENGEVEIGSRAYIHSRNSADALLFILQNLPPHLHEPHKVDKPDRYNIAGDRFLSNLELAQLTADLLGKELKYEIVDVHTSRPGHDLYYGLDMEKLTKLGWKSPKTFNESYKNTLEWQAEHPEFL